MKIQLRISNALIPTNSHRTYLENNREHGITLEFDSSVSDHIRRALKCQAAYYFVLSCLFSANEENPVFLLLPVFSLSYGQRRARLDSLLNLLRTEYSNKQDTNKVNLLYEVAL
jgi:hypothetical protein